MDTESRFWNRTKKKTVYFLLGSAVLSIGTPAIVAAIQPGARFYLLQPIVFGGQTIPNLVAAALWLPWRSARATKVGLILAGLLFGASVLFYIPILTGIVPTGGDMIALGYMLFAFVTLVAILAATAVAFTVSWALAKRAKQEGAPKEVL
jgi:hypothetical protein